jgi:hypothetical protein
VYIVVYNILVIYILSIVLVIHIANYKIVVLSWLPAIHAETVCQGPVISTSRQNVGACNGYNGPDFKPVLPKEGDRVMVTGRYQVDMREMPGGIAELHPVYNIKILTPPPSSPNSQFLSTYIKGG